MVDRIEQARSVVDDASEDTDDSTVRKQLNSIDRGLAAIEEDPDAGQQGDRLEEVESKLVGLGDEAEDPTIRDRLEEARDLIDAFRRDRAQDWTDEE